MTTGFAMIRDNNDNNDSWPERMILELITVTNNFDSEPFAQRVILSCGHWCINTYGNRYKSKETQTVMGCRACFHID